MLNGTWTSDAAGYCLPGHAGPLCEICTTPNTYFRKLTARCEACPAGSTISAVAVGVLLLVVLIAVLTLAAYYSPRRFNRFSAIVDESVRFLRSLGLIAKLKITVSFCGIWYNLQSVYGFQVPEDLTVIVQRLAGWVSISLYFPPDCLGDYRSRLLFISIMPFGLAALIVLCFAIWTGSSYMVRTFSKRGPPSEDPGGSQDARLEPTTDAALAQEDAGSGASAAQRPRNNALRAVCFSRRPRSFSSSSFALLRRPRSPSLRYGTAVSIHTTRAQATFTSTRTPPSSASR